MASDIVPIQLSLTEGDLVTLWAPRWREDGPPGAARIQTRPEIKTVWHPVGR